MKKTKFDFDIDAVEFDERFDNKEYGTTTLYFIAPKEWLGDNFTEAVHSEISIEYPTNRLPREMFATVMMSPTRENSDGDFEDYDWSEIFLYPEEVKALIHLANKQR